MRRLVPAVLACGLFASATLAHEGEVHHDDASAAAPLSAMALNQRPHRLPDGALFLPKPAQRLLGIRTAVWPLPDAGTVSLLAEVQARPTDAVTVTAPAAGRLGPAGDWPLPGQSVRAGEVLAWLYPQLSQREAARRRALAADLEQKLVIADLNVDRLGLQSAVNADQQVATGNIYLEQARAERDAMRRERELLLDSLGDRVALRAGVSGRLLAVPARSGELAAGGQVLFQLSDPSRLRLVAISHEADLGARLHDAHAVTGQGGAVPLLYRGQEPLAGAPGWRLLFDVAGSPELSPGQPIEVQARLDGMAGLPSGACGLAASGATVIWVHRQAERFVPLAIPSCADGAALPLLAGDRVVTQGSELLSQYR